MLPASRLSWNQTLTWGSWARSLFGGGQDNSGRGVRKGQGRQRKQRRVCFQVCDLQQTVQSLAELLFHPSTYLYGDWNTEADIYKHTCLCVCRHICTLPIISKPLNDLDTVLCPPDGFCFHQPNFGSVTVQLEVGMETSDGSWEQAAEMGAKMGVGDTGERGGKVACESWCPVLWCLWTCEVRVPTWLLVYQPREDGI